MRNTVEGFQGVLSDLMTGKPVGMHLNVMFFMRCLRAVVVAVVFIGAVLGAARLGIMLADQQVPPAHTALLKVGMRREIGPASALMVCDHLKGLREYDFRSSGSEQVSVDGVTLLEVGEQGVVLEVLEGSDRRHLKVQVLGGANDGKVVWLLARQFSELPEPRRQ